MESLNKVTMILKIKKKKERVEIEKINRDYWLLVAVIHYADDASL